jgi:hypothetical protein
LADHRCLELGWASERLLQLALIQEQELASALPAASALPRVSTAGLVRATVMAQASV